MTGNDYLWNRTHADGISAKNTIHLVFRRGLERRTGHTDIDAMLNRNTLFLRNSVSHGDDRFVVRLVHIRESWTRREVFATQRMLWEEVDMVADNHKVANLEIRVHASGSVAYEESLNAKLVHNTHRERHFLHRISLVVVESSLHGKDILTAKLAKYELTGMSLNRGNREIRNVLIFERVGISYF